MKLFSCVKQNFRLSFRPDLELEAILPRICPKNRPQLERMDSSRRNTKQIRLIRSSEVCGLYCSVAERLVPNEHRGVGGSAPEFGAVKPRCSDPALVTPVSLSHSPAPQSTSIGAESASPSHA